MAGLVAPIFPWLCVCRRESLPQRPLVAVAVAFVAGCIVGLPGGVGTWFSCGSLWASAVAVLVAWGLAAGIGFRRAAAWSLLVAVGLAGAAWAMARMDAFSVDELAWQLDTTPRPVALRGRIVASPQLVPTPVGDERQGAVMGPSSGCVMAITAARWKSRWTEVDGKARVIVQGEPIDLPVGAQVRVLGRGLRVPAPLNPGEPDFARRSRESRQLSVVRVKSWDCVRITSMPAWWWPPTALDRLRAWASTILSERIATERADLASALLLGQRSGLSRDVTDAFVVTGTIHVLAISGLHVGLLALGLFAVCRSVGVPRSLAGVIVAAVIGGYMLLVGAGTPVVRATVLVWIACGTVVIGRRPAAINSLALAAIILCVWRPADVMSAGAQLSFLSTGVLCGVAHLLRRPRENDPIERLIERSRPRWEKLARRTAGWAASAFVASAAVWVATSPLVAHSFHVVSFVALAINVIVTAIVPVAMACGFLCLVMAPVSDVLAGMFGAGCDVALGAIQAIVSTAATVPGGHAWVAGPRVWWVIGWYGVFIAALLCLRGDLLRRGATWATLAVAWSGVGVVGEAISPRPGGAGLRVMMTAVGHGCGIVVMSPCGRTLVYDAGRLGAASAARRSIESMLWSERITRIDTLVISHADADHFNAVPALLTRFRVGELCVPEPLLTSRSRGVAEILAMARDRKISIRAARAGDSFAIDPLCRARVLHPYATARRVVRPNNETSLVLSIEAAGRRFLLTGDLEGAALREFLSQERGSCDVLVAPHHGTHTSLPADIAAITRPHVVLVSGRGGRRWPEVQSAYAAAAKVRREAVLHTGSDGALAVTLTAGDVSVRRFAAGRWQSVPYGLDQAADVAAGRVASAPTTKSTSWLATYAPRMVSTSLLRP